MNSTSRYYEILHVASSASVEEIRQAYVDLVRVWHPDRFANDPRLQKIAEEKLKDITEAYDTLSSPPSQPEAIPVAPVNPPAPRAKAFHPRPWLVALGSGAVLLLLVTTAVQAIGMLQAPGRAALLMEAEKARIARLFGPDPATEVALAPPVKSKLRSKDTRSSQSPSFRPSNGADLTVPPAGNGLGEFHVRNEYDLDCVIRIIDRNSPRAPLRIIYVQARQEASIAGVQPGIYRMRVSFGRDWTGDVFAVAEASAPDYWIGPFEFFETQSSSERRGLRYKIGVRPPAM